jgi:hypothetical protein
MNTPKEVRQFAKIDTQRLLSAMEFAGKYTVESQIKGVGYVLGNGTIGVIAGKNGILTVDLDMVDSFITELQGIKELAEYKRVLKGA